MRTYGSKQGTKCVYISNGAKVVDEAQSCFKLTTSVSSIASCRPGRSRPHPRGDRRCNGDVARDCSRMWLLNRGSIE